MVDSGALDDLGLDYVFGMHVGPLPKGLVAYLPGTMYAASCLVKISIRGHQVHGSTPWMGLDPMPAAAGVITGIGQIYRQVPGTDAITVSIGHIEDVGRFNIIGETVTLWGTIRSMVQNDMETAQENLRRLAEHQAASFGCTATVEYLQPVAPVVNRQAHLDEIRPTLERVVGTDRIATGLPPTLGYDDVSAFVERFGGAYLSYGVQDTTVVDGQLRPVEGGRGAVPNHNPAFYADDDCLLDSLRIHAHIAADLLTQRNR